MDKKSNQIALSLIIIGTILILYFFKNEVISEINDLSYWLYPESSNRRGLLTDLFLKVLAGIAGVVALKFALDRAKSSIKSAKAQTKAVQAQNKQIELSRNTQLNELFKSAVDHIGSSNETVVLAGAHELHSISNKFPEDYSQIALNVFLSILRIELTSNVLTENKKGLCQGIFNIIFSSKVYDNFNKDLSDCDLSKLNLGGLTLTNVNLIRAKLPHSTSGCTFRICDFRNSTLLDLVFVFCNFEQCYFSNSYIKSVNFHHCIFEQISNNIWFKFFNVLFFKCAFIGYLNRVHFYLTNFVETKFRNGFIHDVEFLAVTFTTDSTFEDSVRDTDFIAVSFTETEFRKDVYKSRFVGIDLNRFNFGNGYKNLIEKLNDFRGTNLTVEELDRGNNEIIDFDSSYYDYVKNKLDLSDELDF